MGHLLRSGSSCVCLLPSAHHFLLTLIWHSLQCPGAAHFMLLLLHRSIMNLTAVPNGAQTYLFQRALVMFNKWICNHDSLLCKHPVLHFWIWLLILILMRLVCNGRIEGSLHWQLVRWLCWQTPAIPDYPMFRITWSHISKFGCLHPSIQRGQQLPQPWSQGKIEDWNLALPLLCASMLSHSSSPFLCTWALSQAL